MQIGKKRKGVEGGAVSRLSRTAGGKKEKLKSTLVQRCEARSQCRKCTPVLRIVVRTLLVKIDLVLYIHFYQTWLVCTLGVKQVWRLTPIHRGEITGRVRIYVLVQTVIVAAAMQKFTSYLSRSSFLAPLPQTHHQQRSLFLGGGIHGCPRGGKRISFSSSSSFLQVQSSKLYHGECKHIPPPHCYVVQTPPSLYLHSSLVSTNWSWAVPRKEGK